jgi:hypothetical protein
VEKKSEKDVEKKPAREFNPEAGREHHLACGYGTTSRDQPSKTLTSEKIIAGSI